MSHRKEKFITGDNYHAMIRAIDDNLVFKDMNDYFRGIFSIYEFNDTNPVTIQAKRKARKAFKNSLTKLEKADRRRTSIQLPEFVDKRNKFVDILAFCFMPNHIHLFLKQLKDDGISKFMQKVGGGYGKYFNTKYQRKGHVFQDSFNAVHIENDNQFMATVSYIFTNPIALIEPGWKENGIKDLNKCVEYLRKYYFSSYSDYLNQLRPERIIINRTAFPDYLPNEKVFEKEILDWLVNTEARPM